MAEPAQCGSVVQPETILRWHRSGDEVISVEEVKIFKTSNRVYWLATERLKVSNPELGFVSANNRDGVAAVSAGLRTLWIERTTAEVPEELGFQVDTTVKAITDLPALLRG